MEVFLIGSEKDRPFLEEVHEMMGETQHAHLFIEPLDLLVALFNRASILVSNESGPTHLAAATDVPIVTVMGPTNESCWGPLRKDRLTILRGPKCEECLWRDCTLDVRCVKAVRVMDVLDAVASVLARETWKPSPDVGSGTGGSQ
jgi:ADP-heptose:LPS heptosyltransferase